MKVKDYEGKSVNGFTILDSYSVTLLSGKSTRKVLLKCDKCGREFERNSGVDFEHIKCKCMCAPKKPTKFKYITYKGETYTQTEFCKIHDISDGTFRSRIKRGLTIDEAIQKEFTKVCPICEKEFKAKNPYTKYCSHTCAKRAASGKGQYKKPYICKCIVCEKEFETIRDDAKTCSKKCNAAWSRIDRNKRYRHLKEIGQFDASVTLQNVYDKYDGICQICGKKLSFDCYCNGKDYPSIYHIKPISKGGSHTWDNVQLLCRNCNDKKSDS